MEIFQNVKHIQLICFPCIHGFICSFYFSALVSFSFCLTQNQWESSTQTYELPICSVPSLPKGEGRDTEGSNNAPPQKKKKAEGYKKFCLRLTGLTVPISEEKSGLDFLKVKHSGQGCTWELNVPQCLLLWSTRESLNSGMEEDSLHSSSVSSQIYFVNLALQQN